eukprot:6030673-Amphidinium_carterae.2
MLHRSLSLGRRYRESGKNFLSKRNGIKEWVASRAAQDPETIEVGQDARLGVSGFALVRISTGTGCVSSLAQSVLSIGAWRAAASNKDA